jgi:ribose 5-phosphate isomerase B
MKVALGADHAGVHLRQAIADLLRRLGHDVADLGTFTTASVDYPLIAAQVCSKVTQGEAQLGILVCGTGIGVSLAANRCPGIRAALCTETYTARLSRQHNNANVLCLGERVVGEGVALGMVEMFLSTPFEGGRHERRVAQLTQLELASCSPASAAPASCSAAPAAQTSGSAALAAPSSGNAASAAPAPGPQVSPPSSGHR